MLAATSLVNAYVGSAPLSARAAPAVRARPCVMEDSDLMLKLNDVFWKTKKAQMEAEMEQRLRDLEEYRAREAALYDTLSVAALPAAGGALAPTADGAAAELTAQMSALMAELKAEKDRSAALEAELEAVRTQAEIDVQKVGAFWIEKLASQGAEAAPAAADAPVAAPAAAPVEKALIPEGLSLRELRSRLLAYGLSTVGLKNELRTRLEGAMVHDRSKHSSWDPVSASWVPA